MSESTDIIPFYANPKIVIPVVVIAIAAAVGIPMLLKYMATVKTDANAGSEAKGNADEANAIATSLASTAPIGTDPAVTQGRAVALIQAAQAIYNEVTKSMVYVSSSLCVAALNQAQTATEMTVLNAAYNNQVSANQRTLAADVNAHVIGIGTSTSDIKFYSYII